MWCPLLNTFVTYDANEYYFQCAKTFGCAAPGMLKLHNEMLQAPNCRTVKAMGRNVPLSAHELALWEARVSLEAMLACNLAKFQQHKDCRQWLLNTGNRPLIEHRRDPKWGDNLDGTGLNLLGKILEVVRAQATSWSGSSLHPSKKRQLTS